MLEGFGFPLFLVLIVVVFLLITGIVLKKSLPSEKANKTMAVIFAALLLASIAIVIISLYIGGWAGMGYGIMGLCILVGTIIAGFLYAIMHYLSSRKKVPK